MGRRKEGREQQEVHRHRHPEELEPDPSQKVSQSSDNFLRKVQARVAHFYRYTMVKTGKTDLPPYR